MTRMLNEIDNKSLEVFKLDPRVKLPRQGTDHSVGFDLHAFLLTESGRASKKMISRYDVVAIPTGLVVRPPEGFYLQVCSRSGLALHGKIFVANAPGIIDPDYTGELMILLYNGGPREHYVEHDHRIAQLVLVPIVHSALRVVEKRPEVVGRGEAGFGSTGT